MPIGRKRGHLGVGSWAACAATLILAAPTKGLGRTTVWGSLLLALVLPVLLSCNPPSEFGADVVPTSEVRLLTSNALPRFRNFTDSIATTVLLDNRTFGNYQLGNYVDPHLGRVTASIFAEFFYAGIYQINGRDTSLTSWGRDIVIDSVVMTLPITSRYGRSGDPQNLEVYFLDGAFVARPPFLSFFNSDSVAVRPGNLVSGPSTISFTDQQNFFRAKVRLAPTAFNRLMNAPRDSIALRTLDTALVNGFFRNIFRGLHIRTAPVPEVAGQYRGAIYNVAAEDYDVNFFRRADFNRGPINDTLNLNIYFSAADSNTLVRTNRRIVFEHMTSRTGAFTRVTRTGTAGRLIDTLFSQPNRATHLVLTGGEGRMVRLKLPGLRDSLPRGVINTATLLLQVDPAYLPQGTDSLRYTPPSTITTVFAGIGADSLKADPTARAQQVFYSSFQRGYVVPLGTYAGLVLAGRNDVGLLLQVGDRTRRSTRVVLAGPDHPNPSLRPRLSLFYTPFDR